jgi:DNA primase
MGVIEEIKQRLDIVEVIGEYVPLTKAGRTFRASCPFHSEKNPSFYVYPERQSWHCFGACSTGGDVFSFIMKKQGIDFGEALHLLASRAGVTIPSRLESETGKDESERLYQVNAAAAGYFHNLLLNSPAAERARDYLASRRLLPKTISDFQLGYSLNSWDALRQYLTGKGYAEPELVNAGLLVEWEAGGTHDRFRNKLVFPIADSRGRVTGFGARVLDDSLPKYINSPQTPVFSKSDTLYGINLAAATIRQQDRAMIVEGYMDVITAHQSGFSNVIASMGTAITEKQISILKRITRNIALALDADEAGEEAMLRSASYENSIGAEVRVIILPKGKDPDEVIKEDARNWQALVERALPVVDYTFNMVTSNLDLATARDKSLAVDKLLPIVAEIKDGVRQTHYLQKLAVLVRINERRLEAILNQIKPARSRRRIGEATPPSQKLRWVTSSPREEYCLTLLLQHPELKDDCRGLTPEYFENTENRVIFTAWQQSQDITSLKESLDPTMHGHVDYLMTRAIPPNQIENKLADCINQLHKEYLRNLKEKRAETTELEERDLEDNEQLREVFARERQMRSGRREEVKWVRE